MEKLSLVNACGFDRSMNMSLDERIVSRGGTRVFGICKGESSKGVKSRSRRMVVHYCFVSESLGFVTRRDWNCPATILCNEHEEFSIHHHFPLITPYNDD